MLVARSPSTAGRILAASASPTTPRNTLTRKIGRHDRPKRLASMMNPASTGPPTVASPRSGPNNAKAFVRISLENVLVMMAMPWGIISAPKAPCVARAAINRAGLGEIPATAEATVKPLIPIRKSRRWPNLSPSRPPTTSRTPMASMYAVPSHLMRLSPPPRCEAMVGAAMFVTVESIMSRPSASSTSARIAHIRLVPTRSGTCAVVVAGAVDMATPV
jgi:hypothetical protein